MNVAYRDLIRKFTLYAWIKIGNPRDIGCAIHHCISGPGLIRALNQPLMFAEEEMTNDWLRGDDITVSYDPPSDTYIINGRLVINREDSHRRNARVIRTNYRCFRKKKQINPIKHIANRDHPFHVPHLINDESRSHEEEFLSRIYLDSYPKMVFREALRYKYTAIFISNARSEHITRNTIFVNSFDEVLDAASRGEYEYVIINFELMRMQDIRDVRNTIYIPKRQRIKCRKSLFE